MRRLLIAMAGVAMLTVLMPTSVGAGGTGPEAVWLVHGIGDAEGQNPVDVYVRETGSGDPFDLLLEGEADDFVYGAIEDTGPAVPGDYDVLICVAVADPLDEIDACADNETPSVNGNFGNVVTIPDAPQVTIFAGYGEGGRPAALVFVPDLACAADNATGRATAAHAADADPVTVSVGDTPVIEDLANGEQSSLDVPAATYEINVTDGVALDIDTSLEVTAVQNTMAYVTGDPDNEEEYTVILQRFDVPVCEQPTTTTTQAVQQQTQPRFTG
jgi:hypothetical protein